MTDEDIHRWARLYFLRHVLLGRPFRGSGEDADWLEAQVPGYAARQEIYRERDRIRERRER